MFHRSERLLLRPIWPEDWRGVLSGIADEGVVRNLAKAPWPYKEDDARQFAARTIDPAFPRFLITNAQDAEIVGCIGIDAMDDAEEPSGFVIEMGYWIARPYWGQGYATEAGEAVLRIAGTLGYQEVVASHFVDNPASGRVLEKLGFERTGRVADRHSCARGESVQTIEFSKQISSAHQVAKRAA